MTDTLADPVPLDAAEDLAETRATLVSLAERKTGAIPADFLVRHLLALDPAADWPVRRAALDAVLRRIGFARRDGLKVAERPGKGDPFGIWATEGTRHALRPYRTLLAGLDPLEAGCDCPDFRRGSLGLCKHVLVVLDELAGRPAAWKRALEARDGKAKEPRLRWNSVRPLVGRDDWLERVRLDPGEAAAARRGAAYRALERRFAPGVGRALVLRSTFPEHAARRLALVEDLANFVRSRTRSRHPVDPALAARIADERAELARTIELARQAPRLRRALGSLRRELYPYQLESVRRFFACGRLLLADDMGLGKTAQAIGICYALFRAELIDRGLLIVPATLKPQWQREWGLFTEAPLELVDGSPAERAAAYRRTKRGFLVANYEQILRDLDLMTAWAPDLVVLDEAQRIKNWAAKTSHGVKQLRPPLRLVLTGTPMENRLEELASIMDWVDDHALEPKWRLVPWHAAYADGTRGIAGVRNLSTLRARMAHCTMRRMRRDILTQLPPRTDTTVPLELTEEQRAAHDDLHRPIASLLHRAAARPLTQAEFLRLMRLLNTQRIIANGMAQLEFAEVWPAVCARQRPSESALRGLFSPKLSELREILSALVLEQERKVVVFSQWRRMLRLAEWATSDLLERSGLRAAFFTGQEGQKRRTQNIVDFHDDPAVRVLFATDAGGVGLNLQRAATACINLELPWNPAVREQRIGRIHRLGQTEPIEVYDLVSRDCIEERIAGLVADKQELFRSVFEGESDEVRFEHSGTFLENVRKIAGDGEPPAPAAGGEEEPEEEAAGERAIEDLVEASDESTDGEPPAPPPVPLELPTGEDLRALFTKLEIRPREDGGLRLEAPPEAAASLAALFEGLASLLRGAERS
ncbi:MAG: DEAD/DEAH box helicase [Planctomycetota bacterium]